MRIVIVIAIFCAFALNLNAQDELSPEMMFALTNGMPPHRTFNLNRSNESFYNRQGRRLMQMAQFPDGNENLVCTNWVCPTSIVVNAHRYEIRTNLWGVGMTKLRLIDSNSNEIDYFSYVNKNNGKEAVLEAFSVEADGSMLLRDYFRNLIVLPLDVSTNSLYLAGNFEPRYSRSELVYKSLVIEYWPRPRRDGSLAIGDDVSPIAIMTAILNAGLPENERIDLAKVDQEKLQKCME